MSILDLGRGMTRAHAPGICLCATVALAAMFLAEHYHAPVMLFALLLGMAINFVDAEVKFADGIALSSKTFLRAGIVLLGVRVTLSEMQALGLLPVVIAVTGLASTMALGVLLSRASGRNTVLGVLTGGAVGICGASAALALSAVLPRGPQGIEDRDTVLTVVTVTALSSIAMIGYPLLVHLLGLGDVIGGIFIGATVHDVAQVVGAGYTVSETAGDTATVVKLLRVSMLVPVLLLAAYAYRSTQSGAGRKVGFRVPGFLLGFVGLVFLNSAVAIPSGVATLLSDASRFLLVVSIAGIGIRTNLRDLVEVGPRAVVILLAETLWIAAFALCLLLAVKVPLLS